MGIKKNLNSLLKRNRNERSGNDRRVASKRERIIFYSKVFNGEVVDRRENLFEIHRRFSNSHGRRARVRILISSGLNPRCLRPGSGSTLPVESFAAIVQSTRDSPCQ